MPTLVPASTSALAESDVANSKEQGKIQEYLAMAQTAAERASASPLDNVREQHERSAAVWLELARSEQARAQRRVEVTLANNPQPAADDVDAAPAERPALAGELQRPPERSPNPK